MKENSKEKEKASGLQLKHDLLFAKCSSELVNYQNQCKTEKLECSNKLLLEKDKNSTTKGCNKKKLTKLQERVTYYKEKHNSCYDRNVLLEEAHNGLVNSMDNCSFHMRIHQEHFNSINDSLDQMRELNSNCMSSLNSCNDDYKSRTEAVTNNVVLSADAEELKQQLDNVTEKYRQCLEVTNSKLSNRSECQANLITCNNHRYNLTNYIQRNLTSNSISKLMHDQCKHNLEYYTKKSEEENSEKSLLKEEVDELRKNRNLTISLWNNTKTELRLATAAVKLLQEEVKLLNREKVTIDTSLKHLIDEQKLTKAELAQVKADHEEAKQALVSAVSHNASCNTELNSCKSGYEEIMEESREHQINGIKCNNAVSKIFQKLNNCGSHAAFERCKKRLRSINSKAYTIMDR